MQSKLSQLERSSKYPGSYGSQSGVWGAWKSSLLFSQEKKLDQLKINISSYIHLRIEVTEQTVAPELEIQTDRFRESQLSGAEAWEQKLLLQLVSGSFYSVH
jgi:hypothetical protein